MSLATVTFSVVAEANHFTANTYLYDGARFEDDVATWDDVKRTRDRLETHMRKALAETGHYPIDAGHMLLRNIGWRKGFVLIQNPALEKLHLIVKPGTTSRLVPELLPIEDKWLDQVLPIYRTIKVGQRAVWRHREMTLAIIYQSGSDQPFKYLAETLQENLLEKGIDVQTFAGDRFGEPQLDQLDEVFFNHRAILFLGHLWRKSTPYGWQMTDDYAVPVKDIAGYLQNATSQDRIPEVVFSLCCSGAWGDPAQEDDPNAFYPAKFLEAGVRYFCGAWMDVTFSIDEEKTTQGWSVLETMVVEFFARWAAEPDSAVQHLYDAKQTAVKQNTKPHPSGYDFHLLTSLYQIYVGGAEIINQPPGAMVSGVAEGDMLGDYMLEQEMWIDPYARTFWAQDKTEGTKHLVQVLVDQLQDDMEISAELDSIIEKLQDAGLPPTHLIPRRHEFAMWTQKDNRKVQRLHTLIYDRPLYESASDWARLVDQPTNVQSPTHFQEVLNLGTQISFQLAELHEKGILHGNLDPTSIVLRHLHKDEVPSEIGDVISKVGWEDIKLPIMKDAWVRQIHAGRTTDWRYAPPEATKQAKQETQLRGDCWGLGMILYRLATGELPYGEEDSAEKMHPVSVADVMPNVPEALDRIVRECFVPDPTLRPSAALIAQRLLLALQSGGTYITQLEQELLAHIQAGYRLFAIVAEDIGDVKPILENLTSRHQKGTSYRLYEAVPQIGLRDARSGNVVVSWLDMNAVTQIFQQIHQQNGLLPGPPPTLSEVDAINSEEIFAYAYNVLAQPNISGSQHLPSQIPILFIHNAGWWEGDTEESELAIQRRLKLCQLRERDLVVIVADAFLTLDSALTRIFNVLYYPPLTPSQLFEKILAAPRSLSIEVPTIMPEVAIEIAQHLYPTSHRELMDAIRLSVLQQGKIDTHLVEVRDERRAKTLRHSSLTSYLPLRKLVKPEYVGLSPTLELQVNQWARAITLNQPAPRRVLLQGRSGAGKTVVAQRMSHQIQRAMLRVEADRCLRGSVGESEAILREMMNEVDSLGRVVVLIDNVHRFAVSGDGQGGATMGRMASIVLQWLDQTPGEVIVIATWIGIVLPQWQRRFGMRLSLDQLAAPDHPDIESRAYRTAVFAAIFRKFGLDLLASDMEFMTTLANGTHPADHVPLRPIARKYPERPLGTYTTELRTPADIESWIAETIYLHYSETDKPESVDFWLKAIEGA